MIVCVEMRESFLTDAQKMCSEICPQKMRREEGPSLHSFDSVRTRYFGKRFCVSSGTYLHGRPQMGSEGWLRLEPAIEVAEGREEDHVKMNCVSDSTDDLLLVSLAAQEDVFNGIDPALVQYPRLAPAGSTIPLPFAPAATRGPFPWTAVSLDGSWTAKLAQAVLGPTDINHAAGLKFPTQISLLAYLGVRQQYDNSLRQVGALFQARRSLGRVADAQEAWILGKIVWEKMDSGETKEDLLSVRLLAYFALLESYAYGATEDWPEERGTPWNSSPTLARECDTAAVAEMPAADVPRSCRETEYGNFLCLITETMKYHLERSKEQFGVSRFWNAAGWEAFYDVDFLISRVTEFGGMLAKRSFSSSYLKSGLSQSLAPIVEGTRQKFLQSSPNSERAYRRSKEVIESNRWYNKDNGISVRTTKHPFHPSVLHRRESVQPEDLHFRKRENDATDTLVEDVVQHLSEKFLVASDPVDLGDHEMWPPPAKLLPSEMRAQLLRELESEDAGATGVPSGGAPSRAARPADTIMTLLGSTSSNRREFVRRVLRALPQQDARCSRRPQHGPAVVERRSCLRKYKTFPAELSKEIEHLTTEAPEIIFSEAELLSGGGGVTPTDLSPDRTKLINVLKTKVLGDRRERQRTARDLWTSVKQWTVSGLDARETAEKRSIHEKHPFWEQIWGQLSGRGSGASALLRNQFSEELLASLGLLCYYHGRRVRSEEELKKLAASQRKLEDEKRDLEKEKRDSDRRLGEAVDAVSREEQNLITLSAERNDIQENKRLIEVELFSKPSDGTSTRAHTLKRDRDKMNEKIVALDKQIAQTKQEKTRKQEIQKVRLQEVSKKQNAITQNDAEIQGNQMAQGAKKQEIDADKENIEQHKPSITSLSCSDAAGLKPGPVDLGKPASPGKPFTVLSGSISIPSQTTVKLDGFAATIDGLYTRNDGSIPLEYRKEGEAAFHFSVELHTWTLRVGGSSSPSGSGFEEWRCWNDLYPAVSVPRRWDLLWNDDSVNTFDRTLRPDPIDIDLGGSSFVDPFFPGVGTSFSVFSDRPKNNTAVLQESFSLNGRQGTILRVGSQGEDWRSPQLKKQNRIHARKPYENTTGPILL